jgi:hypothetical protein
MTQDPGKESEMKAIVVAVVVLFLAMLLEA